MSNVETLRLWDHLFGDLEGYLVAFTGKQRGANNLSAIRQDYYRYPDQRDEASVRLIAAGAAGRDAYFGVHLYAQGGNRRADNAAALIRCLWLDEDDGSFPREGPQPTAVVHSSAQRRHLYWRLSHPVEAAQAASLNKRIAAWAQGDRGKAALTTVLRAPGTYNYKRGAGGEPVTLEITGGAGWDPEVLGEALPSASKRTVSVSVARRDYDSEFDLVGFLHRVGTEVGREIPSPLGRIYEIECPWEHEHSCSGPRDTVVGVLTEGGAWFKCFHDHCAARRWGEFREKVDPRVPAKLRVCKARRVWRRSA